MSETLLQTKLYIPPLRPNLVPRSRLIEQLNRGLRQGSKLTLVSAPAGYGKTTLLRQWVQQTECPTAWLSLDQDDNDSYRFWAYVILALQTILPDFGQDTLETVLCSRPPSIKMGLTNLINEIVEILDPFVLVLEDFHLIASPKINDDVAFLLKNQPPHMHLVLSTRADPPWHLARLRARGEITELRHADLRFTPAEATAFLRDTMDLNLSPDEVAALETRIEGWIAGLQMAAISMKGSEDITEFISSFNGSHRFILDFLVEEVLQQQSENVQEFLFKTSILERMAAPVCDAVMRSSGSQTVLTQLDRANLFLIPLDDDRRWYRYHRLFADLLRSRLEQAHPNLAPTLHQRASAWFEQNESADEAVWHAFAADDLERVVHLVEEHALTMVYQGQLAALASWLARIPTEAMNSRPWLCIAQAWTLVYKGQLDAVEPLLQTAEESLAAEGQRIKGHIAAIRAYAAFLSWDARAMEFAREALDYLSEDDLMVRGLAAMVLAIGYFGSGDLAAAEQAFAEAIVASKATNDRYVAINALCELSDLQTTRGRLHKAAATCRDALQMADASRRQGGKRLPIAGYALGRLSVVLREWNDLPVAKNHAQECVELSKHWGQADAQILAHSFLAGASLANGDTDGALDAIRAAKQMAEMVSPRYRDFVAAREASVLLATGDVTAATRWMTESGLSVDDDPYRPIRNYIVLARVLIAQAQIEKAMSLLAHLLKMAEESSAMGYVIELSILQALALQAAGRTNQALDPLERALSLAETEGYVRIFINEGAPMSRLLRQAIAKGTGVVYAGRLLTALEADAESRRQPSVTARASMVDPLSERELEVMRLLTTHLSSTDIAGELTISVNTVRTHIKSIYGKLGVHSREEAVQKAEALHLL